MCNAQDAERTLEIVTNHGSDNLCEQYKIGARCCTSIIKHHKWTKSDTYFNNLLQATAVVMEMISNFSFHFIFPSWHI